MLQGLGEFWLWTQIILCGPYDGTPAGRADYDSSYYTSSSSSSSTTTTTTALFKALGYNNSKKENKIRVCGSEFRSMGLGFRVVTLGTNIASLPCHDHVAPPARL